MRGQVEGQLTLFQEDSPASHSLLPGSGEARKMTVTSGQKWLGLSRNSGRLGLLEKMLLESSIWHSTQCFLTWRAKDTPHGHFLYRLQVSMPRTSDTGQRLWPTPKAAIRGDCPSERKRRSPDLSAAVRMFPTPTAQDFKHRGPNSRQQGLPEMVRMFTTPTASDTADRIPGNPIVTIHGTIRHRNRAGGQSQMTLSQVAKMYPTPTAQDARNSTFPESQIERDSLVGELMRERYATPQARDYRTGQAKRWKNSERSRNLNDQIAAGENRMEVGSGQLNPAWVEWLMGFPIGWTELSASETQ